MLKFQVVLAGNIYLEKGAYHGVRLGSNSRTRSIQVVSLSDLVVENMEDKKEGEKLKVRASRESQDSNRFDITFTVPQSTKKAFQTEVKLKDTRPGGASVTIPVSFDPRDDSVPVKSSKPSQAPSDAGRRQNSSGERPEAAAHSNFGFSQSSGSSLNKQDRGSSTIGSYVVVGAIVILGGALLCEACAIVSKLPIFVRNQPYHFYL